MNEQFSVMIEHTGDSVSVLTDAVSGNVTTTIAHNSAAVDVVETPTASLMTTNINQFVGNNSNYSSEMLDDDDSKLEDNEKEIASPSAFPTNIPLPPPKMQSRFCTETAIELLQDDGYDSDGEMPPTNNFFEWVGNDDTINDEFFEAEQEQALNDNNNNPNANIFYDCTTNDVPVEAHINNEALFTTDQINRMSVVTLKDELKKRGVSGINGKRKPNLVFLLTNWTNNARDKQNANPTVLAQMPTINHNGGGTSTVNNNVARRIDFLPSLLDNVNDDVTLNIENTNNLTADVPLVQNYDDEQREETIVGLSPYNYWVPLQPSLIPVQQPVNIDDTFRAPTVPEDEFGFVKPKHNFEETFD
jgi:hypothetical protein